MLQFSFEALNVTEMQVSGVSSLLVDGVDLLLPNPLIFISLNGGSCLCSLSQR